MQDLSYEFQNVQDKLEWLQKQFDPLKQTAIFSTLGFVTDQVCYAKGLHLRSQSEISDTVKTKTGQVVELLDRKTIAGGRDN